MLNLSNLKKFNNKKKKRLGRGNASGHGTYCTRGIKGQRARSGGRKNLKIKGFKQVWVSIPKNRGFNRLKIKAQGVNFEDINRNFAEGEKINFETLCNKGLIGDKKRGVKILAKGKLEIKGLQIEGCSLSKVAKEELEKQGGKVLEN